MNKKVLITAGPTRENIDPIRFITNRSSGKMGYAIAKAFISKGARVKLISGAVKLKKPNLVTLIKVETAEEMAKAVFENFDWADIVVMAAAVSDYKPATVLSQKIKKRGDLKICLKRTPDILLKISQRKRANQIIVGFALETENIINNAKKKLLKKNLDIIIANSEKAQGSDIADVWIIDKKSVQEFKKTAKKELAEIITNKISNYLR